MSFSFDAPENQRKSTNAIRTHGHCLPIRKKITKTDTVIYKSSSYAHTQQPHTQIPRAHSLKPHSFDRYEHQRRTPWHAHSRGSREPPIWVSSSGTLPFYTPLACSNVFDLSAACVAIRCPHCRRKAMLMVRHKRTESERNDSTQKLNRIQANPNTRARALTNARRFPLFVCIR